jgi:hypothetical protein
MVAPTDSAIRSWLAPLIIGLSVSGIVLASAVALWVATDKAEMARLIFASVLPLFGTWVGTVLAFYYAKDNLQAATESTIRLSGKVDPASPVSSAMIPRSEIQGTTVPQGSNPAALQLDDLVSSMAAAKRQRWPIFNTDGEILYILHKSTLDAFKAAHPPTAGSQQTLADLLAVPVVSGLLSALGFVKPNDSLSQARAVMRSVPNCNDIFVTGTGTKDAPVHGWLTNSLLAGAS